MNCAMHFGVMTVKSSVLHRVGQFSATLRQRLHTWDMFITTPKDVALLDASQSLMSVASEKIAQSVSEGSIEMGARPLKAVFKRRMWAE